MRQERCNKCGSGDVKFDRIYGFYECLACGNLWGYPEDDPDLEEPLICLRCAGRGFVNAILGSNKNTIPIMCQFCNGTGFCEVKHAGN